MVAKEGNWPTYTVLCPLYKEWQVVPQFISAMTKLDYPKNKLQIMLLLEEDDTETLTKVKEFNLPKYFEVVVVPNSFPKTKPKACNYGLTRATGEYVVIYDAEDIPDSDQLKKAVLAFQKVNDRRVVCIQAKLNFYNPHQNLLTRLFTAEYSLWFDLVLTGLQSIHAPIPLGGTSNHFRSRDLKDLKGWDSFNVTEDCDLGMRLVKRGYRTAVVESMTLEEANSNIKNWFGQRTRWIKGYMQTYLVHMRNPGQFIRNWKEPHVITFQLVVGGKVLSMFINPLMWTITIVYFVFRSTAGPFIESFFPMPILYMALASIIFGNFLYMYYYMIGCAKRGHYSLVKYALLVPFYWLAMSLAAWVAFYRLIMNPHYWSKTKHGLHLEKMGNESTIPIGNIAFR
jgi:cellulose synthase/poly-beta-1,6-N-acetylglucosamine synthase-like glycosyltransferase